MASSGNYVLVLDAGSSGPRCHLFDASGTITSSSRGQWNYRNEQEASTLARSFDTEQVWSQFCSLIKSCLASAQISLGEVAAVSVTSQRQGVVFLDDYGSELYAGPNIDLRAVFEGAAIDDEFRDLIYQTTGHLPSFLFTPAKLRWFRLHRPDVYGRISSVLTLADWLVWRLTGVNACEVTLAGEAGLLDIHRRELASDLMKTLDVHRGNQSLEQSGSIIGKVTASSSKEVGLKEATPVAIAGADTQCGLLGLGIANELELGIVAGWSAPLQMLTCKPMLSLDGKTWAGCSLYKDKWVLESSAGDIGNSYHWLAKTLFGEANDTHTRMDDLAASVPIGSDGATAFLGHTRMNMTELGMKTGGILFPTPLTFSEVSNGHLVRASLESMAYSIRANLEQIEGLVGHQAGTIAVGGGMTQTKTFNQILPNVLGREVKLSSSPPISAIGAYLCARSALTEYSSLNEAAQSAKSALLSLEPDVLDSAEYDDYYHRWLELSDEISGISL